MNQNQSKRKPTAREVALDVLTKVEQEGAYSNLLLNQSLQKLQLERSEAAFATELVYGTIQRLNTIDYFLTDFVAKGMSKLQPWVRNLLRISFYQLYYLDRIPAHAAVNEAVNIAKRKGHQGISGMVNGVLRNVLRRKEQLNIDPALDPVTRIAVTYSHPAWLVEKWMQQYGEKVTIAMCASNNTAPNVSVRVNSSRTDRNSMLEKMREAGVQARPSELSKAGIIVESGGNMALTDWFAEGLISIQDESSMLVAEAVNPKPGMKVLDCCAAPGGKTAHIAEKMGDQGTVLANDVHPHKQKLIADQAQRLKLQSIRTMVGDALELGDKLEQGSFDRILLDAPCSGLGVIRRKPDLKWAKQPEEIDRIADLQSELLDEVQSLVRPGGILVYSTCTIEPQENEERVRSFLQRHSDFELAPAETESEEWKEVCARVSAAAAAAQPGVVAAGMIQILPHYFHSDGFFIARLQKKK